MKTYSDYETNLTSQLDAGVYSAFKAKAEKKFGITFNHHLYFQYRKEENADCIINGKFAKEFEPSLTDNYYQSNVGPYIILSKDMNSFYVQDCSLEYQNKKEVSDDEIKEIIKKGRAYEREVSVSKA